MLEVVVDEDEDEDEDELEVEVEAEVEAEVEDDDVDKLDVVELDVVLLVVVLEVVVVLVAAAQVSFSETIAPWTGRFRLEIGVPGVMLTLKVYVCPSATVMVTVHASADASGAATIPITVSAIPTTVNNNSSLPLSGTGRPSPIREQRVPGSRAEVHLGWC